MALSAELVNLSKPGADGYATMHADASAMRHWNLAGCAGEGWAGMCRVSEGFVTRAHKQRPEEARHACAGFQRVL
jgi:hypothetical protein